MLDRARLLLASCSLLLALDAFGASTSSYSMTIGISHPKGSASEKLLSTQPTGTDYSPCDNDAKLDAVSFELSYKAGSDESDLRDVYVFFFTPNADGETSARYFAVSKRGLFQGGVAIIPRHTVEDIDPVLDIYQDAESNLGGSVTENLISSSILLDGIPVGTWHLVGIVADSASVDFKDPETWEAWDVVTLILGMPWAGTGTGLCE
jgi:hypothetical protein